MADVSKINNYNLKDAQARSDIEGIKNGTIGVGTALNANNAIEAETANNYAQNGGIKSKFDSVDAAVSAAQAAAATAQGKAESAESIAKGRTQSKSYATTQAMADGLNAAAKDFLKVGDNVYIEATNVPDFWVSAVNDTQTSGTLPSDWSADSYNYGYFTIRKLESEKVDLGDYVQRTEFGTLEGEVDTNTSDIAAIKNGTQKVGAAMQADSANNYNSSTGTIKEKFAQVDSNISAASNAASSALGKANEAYTLAQTANGKSLKVNYSASTEELTISFG